MLYLLIFLLILIIATVWLLWEPYCIEIKKLELKYKNLPEKFHDFSILFLSDIHTSKWGFFEKCLCNKIKKVSQTDICVITGDLAYTEGVTENIVRITECAKVKGDTYIVFGNTEYKSHNNPDKLEKIYSGYGYNVLRNKSVILKSATDSINIVGLDDPINDMDNIGKAFLGVDKDSFSILLTHCPSMGIDAIDYDVNLVLAGHTHGGQVKLPFFTVYTHMKKNKFFNIGIWSEKKLGKKLKRKIENYNAIISNGLGTSVLWIRFFARPQIYRIVLKKDD